MVKVLDWDSGDVGFLPSFATDFLCDLGQVTYRQPVLGGKQLVETINT